MNTSLEFYFSGNPVEIAIIIGVIILLISGTKLADYGKKLGGGGSGPKAV